MVKKSNPPLKFAVLTEFGEELAGHRKNICRFLSEETKHRLHENEAFPIIPGDVGLRINLQTGTVYCASCDQPHLYNDVVSIEQEGDIIRYVRDGIYEKAERNCQWPRP